MKRHISKELKLGMKIEMEHTKGMPVNLRKGFAKKIANDHLKEFSNYYSKGLIPMEKKLKKKR